jgi:hypothetical protein
MVIVTFGIDLAKSVFAVDGVKLESDPNSCIEGLDLTALEQVHHGCDDEQDQRRNVHLNDGGQSRVVVAN